MNNYVAKATKILLLIIAISLIIFVGIIALQLFTKPKYNDFPVTNERYVQIQDKGMIRTIKGNENIDKGMIVREGNNSFSDNGMILK